MLINQRIVLVSEGLEKDRAAVRVMHTMVADLLRTLCDQSNTKMLEMLEAACGAAEGGDRGR